jgi:hypothetical protein
MNPSGREQMRPELRPRPEFAVRFSRSPPPALLTPLRPHGRPPSAGTTSTQSSGSRRLDPETGTTVSRRSAAHRSSALSIFRRAARATRTADTTATKNMRKTPRKTIIIEPSLSQVVSRSPPHVRCRKSPATFRRACSTFATFPSEPETAILRVGAGSPFARGECAGGS